jgi:alpha,alpha-trehalose phosphorylase
VLELDPHLPEQITRLRFRIRWRGLRVTVDANHGDVVYGLTPCDGSDGARLTIRHAGAGLDLSSDESTTVRLKERTPSLPEPRQPAGRRPQRCLR